MADDAKPGADADTGVAPAPKWYRNPVAFFWYMQDSGSRGKVWARSAWALVLLVGGFAISEAYAWARTSVVDPDAYLKKIEAKQDASFKALQDSLGRLSGSLETSDKAVLREVQVAANEIKVANQGLIQQLALAKIENERLQKIATTEAGVRGGYDFIMSPQTSLILEDEVTLGLHRVSRVRAYGLLNAPGEVNKGFQLTTGQSMAYRNAAGLECTITALSLLADGAASFSRRCA